MRNIFKKTITAFLALCLAMTSILYTPTAASAASCKKSASKNISYNASKVNMEPDLYEGVLTINLKKAAKVKLTVKRTDGKAGSFAVYHSSGCSCKDNHVEANFAEKSKTCTLEMNLCKGKHIINIASNGKKLKATLKANKAVLKIVKWKDYS